MNITSAEHGGHLSPLAGGQMGVGDRHSECNLCGSMCSCTVLISAPKADLVSVIQIHLFSIWPSSACWLLSLQFTLQSSRTVPKPDPWEVWVFSLAAVCSCLGKKRDSRYRRVYSSANSSHKLTVLFASTLQQQVNGYYCWAILSCDGSLVFLHRRQKN